MQKVTFKKSVLGVFAVALVATGPSTAVSAAPTAFCNDAITWCKYADWETIYDSFPECIEEESELRCPSMASAASGGDLVARLNDVFRDERA